MADKNSCLVGDVGATYTRLAPATAKSLGRLEVYKTREFDGIETVIRTYLAKTKHKFQSAALAVAGPISDGKVTLVNAPWSFSVEGLQKTFSFQEVLLFNDFEAVAMAIPGIVEKFLNQPGRDLYKIGGGEPIEGYPMAVLGPGTGLRDRWVGAKTRRPVDPASRRGRPRDHGCRH